MATSICIDLSPASARVTQNGDTDTHNPSRDATITIQCLSELTPLDMMDMSFGRADPTGNCVWLGAFLFMEMFARDLASVVDEETQSFWSQIRSTLFPPGCSAIELGAGSGIAGLSMMVMSTHETPSSAVGPSVLVQTDVSDDSLELCRNNHDANLDSNGKERICAKKLEWGKGNASKVFGCQNGASNPGKAFPTTYDAAIATDVLYDLSSLAPLVATASELLNEGGYFVLSHVPRASIDDDGRESPSNDEVDLWQRLESIIISEAAKENLFLAHLPPIEEGTDALFYATINGGSNHMILRPTLLPRLWSESSSLSKKHTWQKMIDVGAAILVFRKKGS